MVNTMKELRVEANASDYATGAVLSMKDDNGKWPPCAYLSKGLNDIKHNYDVHNKELLGVVHALEAWQAPRTSHSNCLILQFHWPRDVL